MVAPGGLRLLIGLGGSGRSCDGLGSTVERFVRALIDADRERVEARLDEPTHVEQADPVERAPRRELDRDGAAVLQLFRGVQAGQRVVEPEAAADPACAAFERTRWPTSTGLSW